MKNDGKYSALFVALPDAVSTAGFVMVWASPFVFGPLSVKTAMLTMLVEFFLVHAVGDIGCAFRGAECGGAGT